MALRRLFRTYSFRTTLLYVAVFGIAIGLLFVLIYWITGTSMKKELRNEVTEEMTPMLEDYESGGVGRLEAIIKERAGSSGYTKSFYLLQDSTGKKIAGNLLAMTPAQGWYELRIPFEDGGEDPSDILLAHGQTLPNGWFLVVGQSMDEFGDIEDWILQVAGWGLAAAFIMALVGGLATSARILRRIEAITAASGEIVQGNLSHRIALRGTNDEFDQLSSNLNEMLDRIQMLMEGLRQMSNDIAHDLRTPLTRLRQHLEGAQTKAATAAEYGEIVGKAIKETDDILHTFGALMRIAQIEAGTRRSAFTDVDFSNVLATIVEAYTAVAEDERHALANRISQGIVVRGDQQLLTQMMANLVENALRHTPAGTRVEIALDGDPAAPVCTVADNGPGIPEEERDKVFRRFYRMDRSRSTTGAGLGLSLVAAIADLHRIGVEVGDQRPGLKITLRFPGIDRAAASPAT
ncbi:MAG TPA: HAMP domain-containing sensor histidine kinase [Dongiaceae bacterium]|jgi:signal transduction histidine kinase